MPCSFFLNHSLISGEKQFHQSVSIALKRVSDQVNNLNAEISGDKYTGGIEYPVERLSNNYYVVNTYFPVVDIASLEHFLITQFEQINLNTDFEYAVYNCESDQMVYGNYISAKEGALNPEKDDELPKYERFTYYFGVYFPDRTSYFNSQLKWWYVFVGLLLIAIAFFGYTLYIVFKQRKLTLLQKHFINNITHEFKTPLASISVSADVLTSPDIEKDTDRLHQYGQIVKAQSANLTSQLNRILKLTATNKSDHPLQIRKTELNSFIKKVVDNFCCTIPGASIEATPSSHPVYVMADPAHLSNILINLLDNAVKYTETPPSIQVNLSYNNGIALLAVADNGMGIERKYRKRIFRKFFRIPTGDTHNVKGFGLGLNYVAYYVKLHNWKITLGSSVGKGSTFTIQMPATHE